MSGRQEVTYTLDFEVRRRSDNQAAPRPSGPAEDCIPRIARLMALAIRLEGLIREQTIPDYASVARRGRVTRARMTQIMKLLDLAPDIQEQILFLPPLPRVNERNLRPIVRRIDWHEQRRLFQKLTSRVNISQAPGASSVPRKLYPGVSEAGDLVVAGSEGARAPLRTRPTPGHSDPGGASR